MANRKSRPVPCFNFPANFDRTPQGLTLCAVLQNHNAGAYAARLWGWAVEYNQPTCSLTPDALADLCRWEGDPMALVDAFDAARIRRKEDGHLYDWDDLVAEVAP